MLYLVIMYIIHLQTMENVENQGIFRWISAGTMMKYHRGKIIAREEPRPPVLKALLPALSYSTQWRQHDLILKNLHNKYLQTMLMSLGHMLAYKIIS